MSEQIENDYYEYMPEDFKEAVKVIRQYCQNEDCMEGDGKGKDGACLNCPYPLSVVRCGDSISI